jgi:hypothetical protein
MTGFTSKRQMAQDKEALKLALDALETADEAEFWNKQKEAITAIREALAQPAQEPVAWGFRSGDGAIYDCISPEAHADCEGEYTVPLYTAPPAAQPKQDPVAADLEVRRLNGPWQRYNVYSSVAVAEDAMKRIEGAPIEVRVLPLYTTPQQRPWVGLTDENTFDIAIQIGIDVTSDDEDYIYIFCKAIQAALKEKNFD